MRLPLTAEPFASSAARSFLDGLLLEGDARRTIADDFRLRPDDTFGLAGELGRDGAGALAIQPDGDPPPAVGGEAFRMAIAKQLGLPVADVETMTVAGCNLIVVARCDRVADSHGRVEHIHQEDFCTRNRKPTGKEAPK